MRFEYLSSYGLDVGISVVCKACSETLPYERRKGFEKASYFGRHKNKSVVFC